MLTDESPHTGGKINRRPWERENVLVLLCFPSLSRVFTSIRNTGRFSPLLSSEYNIEYYLSFSTLLPLTSWGWNVSGSFREAASNMEGKLYLLLKTKQKSFLPFLFLLKSELDYLQREFCTLWSQLRVGEVPGTSFAVSEEALLGACIDRSCSGWLFQRELSQR